MTDIVERLRGRMEWWKNDCEDLRAGANEILRLRAENEKLHGQAAMNGKLLTENAELREQLRLANIDCFNQEADNKKLRAETITLRRDNYWLKARLNELGTKAIEFSNVKDKERDES